MKTKIITILFTLLLNPIAQSQEYEQLSLPTKTTIQKINPNEIDTSAAYIFLKQLETKFKSCLIYAYNSQIKYKKQTGQFTTENQNLDLNKASICDNLVVTTDFADENKFKVSAKRGELAWSINEAKNIVKVQ